VPALLGGAYSSTATTVVLAKRQREAGMPRAIGFGGLSAAGRPAIALVVLALLGLAAAAAYLR
jgi:hypothetical protein